MKKFLKEFKEDWKKDVSDIKNSWFFGRLYFLKTILIMRLTFQPRAVVCLEKGAYYLRRGAKLQVGQPVYLPIPNSTKKRKRYVANMFFNFRSNSLTANYQDKPLKGLSERFNEKKG